MLSPLFISFLVQCSPDTILRMATDKRLKQLERECHLASTGEQECATRKDLEAAWKDFTKLSDQYRDAVKKCRETAGRSRRNHRLHRKRHTIHKEESVSEQVLPESEQFDRPHPIRTRRQTCKTRASDDLNKLRQDFVTHCDRENICLPDEDLPAGTQRDRFKELHAARAKKYSAYLTQLSLCYGRLS
ncbi:hypothetical protein Y032_0475g2134 [Ancylostoma ceylanicum]|uniref:Uncharacterized protein n=1 Tax=Ancylostoma ceylanicum TaxID=53326 RepID=A0A016WWN2_9BILA|nr:hypothetical protein Y032_0475g2134 [Ancylostoma ceylanicum]